MTDDKSNRVVTPLNIDKDLKAQAKKAGLNMSQTANDAIKAMIEIRLAEGDLKELEDQTILKLLSIRKERQTRGDILTKGFVKSTKHEKKIKDKQEEFKMFKEIVKKQRGKLSPSARIFWANKLGVDKEELYKLI